MVSLYIRLDYGFSSENGINSVLPPKQNFKTLSFPFKSKNTSFINDFSSLNTYITNFAKPAEI